MHITEVISYLSRNCWITLSCRSAINYRHIKIALFQLTDTYGIATIKILYL